MCVYVTMCMGVCGLRNTLTKNDVNQKSALNASNRQQSSAAFLSPHKTSRQSSYKIKVLFIYLPCGRGNTTAYNAITLLAALSTIPSAR